MSANISFSSPGFSADDLDRLSREIEVELAKLTGVSFQAKPAAAVSNQRGDPVTIGTFLLAMVTSGAVTALFNIIKAYLERGVDCTFEARSSDGSPVKIQMKGVTLAQFRGVLEDAKILK